MCTGTRFTLIAILYLGIPGFQILHSFIHVRTLSSRKVLCSEIASSRYQETGCNLTKMAGHAYPLVLVSMCSPGGPGPHGLCFVHPCAMHGACACVGTQGRFGVACACVGMLVCEQVGVVLVASRCVRHCSMKVPCTGNHGPIMVQSLIGVIAPCTKY